MIREKCGEERVETGRNAKGARGRTEEKESEEK